MGVQSPSHWTAGEVPVGTYFKAHGGPGPELNAQKCREGGESGDLRSSLLAGGMPRWELQVSLQTAQTTHRSCPTWGFSVCETAQEWELLAFPELLAEVPPTLKCLGLHPASDCGLRVKQRLNWECPGHDLPVAVWGWGLGAVATRQEGAQRGQGPLEAARALSGGGPACGPPVPLQLASLSAAGQRSRGPGAAITSGRGLILDSSHFAL